MRGECRVRDKRAGRIHFARKRVFPMGCGAEPHVRIMDSEPEKSKGLRPLIVDNYTIFFVIKDGDIVSVARVLFSASDISMRLTED